MRLPRWLHPRAALLAEIERLRAANAKLTEERDTAQLWSWVRLRPPPPPPPTRRPDPHVVYPARHRGPDAAQTELHPRAVQRREPAK